MMNIDANTKAELTKLVKMIESNGNKPMHIFTNKAFIAYTALTVMAGGMAGLIMGRKLGQEEGLKAGYEMGYKDCSSKYDEEITKKFASGEWIVGRTVVKDECNGCAEDDVTEQKEVITEDICDTPDYTEEETVITEEEAFAEQPEYAQEALSKYVGCNKYMHRIDEEDRCIFEDKNGKYGYCEEMLYWYPQDPDEAYNLIPAWDDTEKWDDGDCKLQLGEGFEDFIRLWNNEMLDELYYVNYESSIVYHITILSGLRCGYLDADENDYEMTFPEIV